MNVYELLIQNKDFIKLFYLIISIICLGIVFRTHRLYKISLHQGIRYFRNAFFCYSLAFFVRAIIGLGYLVHIEGIYFLALSFAMKYFIIMAGFFLLYSLIWKNIESEGEENPSSFFNPRVMIFHLITLILVVADLLFQTHFLLFVSQIFVFTIATAISYNNYKSRGKKRKFLWFYFLAMVLFLLAWIINAFAGLLFLWNQKAILSVHIINVLIFLIFFFGVLRQTKPN